MRLRQQETQICLNLYIKFDLLSATGHFGGPQTNDYLPRSPLYLRKIPYNSYISSCFIFINETEEDKKIFKI
jgi:hypothetical protein